MNREYGKQDDFKIEIIKGGYTILSEGYYRLQLVEIIPGFGKYGEKYDLVFNVVRAMLKDDSPTRYKGCRIVAFVSRKVSPKSKFCCLINALTGSSYRAGESARRSELIEKQCYAYIITEKHINHITCYLSIEEYNANEK